MDAPLTILLADDDPDDRLMTREALEEATVSNPLHTVEDGEQLLDYLFARNDLSLIHISEPTRPY